MFALFGPAASVASVAIGAGETIVVVRCGSWFAYDLLWLVLLSAIVKGVFVTYLLGRYTAVCGEPLGQRLARVPGPRGWLLLALVVLEMAAAGPLWGAVARPCGDLLFHLYSGGESSPHELVIERVLTSLFIAAALLVRLFLTYDKLEKQQVELLAFDEKLRPFADKRTSLDLDDGVKVNYGKFGDLLAEVKAVHGKKPEDV